MRLTSLFGVGLTALVLSAPQPSSAQETPQTQADVQPGQPYVVARHRDWEILCTRFTADGPELCEMYQLLLGEDETPLAEISVAILPEGEEFEIGATVTAPLETFLLPGMAWQIGDDGALREEPFQVCNQVGCIALLGFEADEVAAMQRGSHAFVLFRPFAAPDQVVGARVSLMGFTAALSDLRERSPREPAAPTAD